MIPAEKKPVSYLLNLQINQACTFIDRKITILLYFTDEICDILGRKCFHGLVKFSSNGPLNLMLFPSPEAVKNVADFFAFFARKK
jgi:hypothetical protein